MLSAVEVAAAALVVFGAPFDTLTVTRVDALDDVVNPVAVSRADTVDIDPACAFTGIEIKPSPLTTAALVFDELKVSPDAGSTALVPSL